MRYNQNAETEKSQKNASKPSQYNAGLFIYYEPVPAGRSVSFSSTGKNLHCRL